MSQLSELLMSIIAERNLRPADLAAACTLEHSTLYQYLNGKRPIRKKEHLSTITDLLQLTIAEQRNVTEAFQIEQLGLSRYNQRKAFQTFLHSLKDTQPPSDAYTQSLSNLGIAQNEAPQGEELLCLRSEIETKAAVYATLKYALLHNEPIDIILQPEQEELLHALFLFGASKGDAPVRHILCMDSDIATGRCDNLAMLTQVLKYCVCCKTYVPLYYYGKKSERFGCSNLLPGLILTATTAIQLAWNGQNAFLHRKPEHIALFKQYTEELIADCTKPLSVDYSITKYSDYPKGDTS